MSKIPPPGHTLAKILKQRGMTEEELAKEIGLGCSSTLIREIIAGRGDIIPRVAYRLQDILSVPALFWIQSQAEYRGHSKARTVVFVCERCGSEEVECVAWIKANTNIVSSCERPVDDAWCPDCEERDGCGETQIIERKNVK